MGEKINVAPGVQELTIRKGEALPLNEPTPVDFKGLLTAPKMFFESRKSLLKKEQCHVIVDEREGSIAFIMDEKNKFKDVIKGQLSVSKIIKEFNINSEKDFFYTDKQLAQLFKMNQYYFAEKTVQANIVKVLMSFTAHIDKVIENNKDNKGNYKKLIEATVKTDVPEKFIMKAPLFEGYPATEFEVFICAEASTNTVQFYLESPELYRMQEETKRSIIEEELKPFIEFGCPVLYK